VVAALLPEEQVAAKRILSRLVTVEGTRARRAIDEVVSTERSERSALEALVGGGWSSPHHGGHNTCELAHEALVTAWARSASGSIRTRKGGGSRPGWKEPRWNGSGWASADVLWHTKQLEEAERLEPSDLGERAKSFLAASRRAERRRRIATVGLVLAGLLFLALAFGIARTRAQSEISARVAEILADGRAELGRGLAASKEFEAHAKRAYLLYDLKLTAPALPAAEGIARWQEADAEWQKAIQSRDVADASLSRAAQKMESGLLLGPSRSDLRSEIAEAIYHRILLARLLGRSELVGELLDRLSQWDTGGVRSREFREPATVELRVDAEPAQLTLEEYEAQGKRLVPRERRKDTLHASERLMLPPGSYRLVVDSPDRVTVRLPIRAEPGAKLSVHLPLPRGSEIPEGFVLVPSGGFLFGSRDEESLRTALLAVPMHEVFLPTYLIGRHEVTFRQWIEFLEALAERERIAHTPSGPAQQGQVLLTRAPAGLWTLRIQPGTRAFVAAWGQLIHYPERTRASTHDWRSFPASGVSPNSIRAYARWLDSTGRVPGARLCNEFEWQKAARGVDGRTYTTGEIVDRDDANFDETYGRKDLAFGPDSVGSHPSGASPYGVMDLQGNALEVIDSSRWDEAAAVNGGSWYNDSGFSGRLMAHGSLENNTKLIVAGARICATPQFR
jgi:formylglycine-generating enzyme required for sulfatase activity